MSASAVLYPSYAALPHPRMATDDLTLVALTSAEQFAGLFAKCAALNWGLRAEAGAAERVAVELIARAVETTGNPDPRPRYTELLKDTPPRIGIRVSPIRTGLLVEVWDTDPTPPIPPGGAYLDQHLAVVHELSRRWNWYRHGGGKVIWAELGAPQPRQSKAHEPLPRRTAGRFSFPEPETPVEPVTDLGVLRSVLEGLHRLDEEGERRGQL